jgi:putative phosphoribosyl transferase
MPATVPFRNRSAAGRALAARLTKYANRPDALVLALPRGGVPVAYEVAAALNVPLDVFLVRKLGVPGQEELAMGAIASGGTRVMNEDVVRFLHLDERHIASVVAREQQEIERRERAYRDGRPPLDLRDRSVIVIDDGLATGATMRAAARAIRAQGPAEVVIAVPVAARETCEDLRNEVDEIVCATTPDPFHAVGLWYQDFDQTTDDEVRALLARNREQHGVNVR